MIWRGDRLVDVAMCTKAVRLHRAAALWFLWTGRHCNLRRDSRATACWLNDLLGHTGLLAPLPRQQRVLE